MAEFNDPIKPKKERSQDPFLGLTRPKDQVHSGSYNMGTNFGVGFTQPMGSEKSTRNSPVPSGCRQMSADMVIDGETRD